ncbi:T9SS type A sorting domain-containing protein [Winogradskyella maritima]|uniref:T9SS type A sorting domain-containing protein n=1 Tax=Winogradskyella maritima TaxID=1517766 RepID=A0ABV8ADV2_9FLAO|nr:T9SS type A sorting domain-containing protein [Winogradskyella maritima]
MKICLLFILIPLIGFNQTQIGSDIDGEFDGDRSGVCSISGDGNRIAVGASRNDGTGFNAGHVRVYELQSGNWVQMGQDIDGEASNDLSGTALSLSHNGNRIAIGAPQNSSSGTSAGHVRVYELQTNTWVQIGQDIDGESSGDDSGEAVSISGDGNRVAIGARQNDGNGDRSGQIRIYELQSNNWVQLGADIDGQATLDFFGWSVSISSDGSRVAASAINNDTNGSNSGQVRVFEFHDNDWIQLGGSINGEGEQDQSGFSLSLSANGNIVAIGANRNDGNGSNAGHVRVFKLQSNNWVQLGQDIDGELASDLFGEALSLSDSGNRIAIGAPFNDSLGDASGRVTIYDFQNNSWTQVGTYIDGEAPEDFFGQYLEMSSDGERIIIGAIQNSGSGSFQGHARVFDLPQPTLDINSFLLETVRIYPNPTKDVQTISLPIGLELEGINIFNSLGQKVLHSKKSNLNLNKLSPGTYVLEINTSNGKVLKKIIKE